MGSPAGVPIVTVWRREMRYVHLAARDRPWL